jgi:hypothetical protein
MNDLIAQQYDMTPEEAEQCVACIRGGLNDIRALILDLYERKGWVALGYANWRDCVTAEFKESQAYLYRQLEAAQAEKVISPIGEIQIPESQLRPLTKLRNDPEKQREAWKVANDTAPDGKVTAAHVQAVVQEMTGAAPKVYRLHREPPPADIPPSFKKAFDNLAEEIKNAKALNWRTISKENAARYVQALLDIITI